MADEAVMSALARLQSCSDAAEMIYNPDLPLSMEDTANGGSENYSTTIARRISMAMARLSDLAQPSSLLVRTPRMILYELMDIVRQALYQCLPDDMRSAATDKLSGNALFHLYASTHRVPLDSMLEGLFVVSYVSTKLRVELVMVQLRRRVEEELRRGASDDEALAALVVTETLLEDFAAMYGNIVLAFPVSKVVRESAALSAATPSAASAAATALLHPMFVRYYHQLCEWLMLMESSMRTPPISLTEIKKLSVDESSGQVMVDLMRPSCDCPWGLLFNEQGFLVDIDVGLRVFDKGRELHELLLSTSQGATILQANNTPLPSQQLYNMRRNSITYAEHVLSALQVASQSRKHLRLLLKSPAFRSTARNLPVEVAFYLPPQGGEATSGQRATIVLHRRSLHTGWSCEVDGRLYWRSPPARVLSRESRAFVKAYGRRLRVLAVNGIEALQADQVTALMERAETVVVELLVMPALQRSPPPPPAAASSVGGPGAMVGAGGAVDRARVATAVAQWMERRQEPVSLPSAKAEAMKAVVDVPLVPAVAKQRRKLKAVQPADDSVAVETAGKDGARRVAEPKRRRRGAAASQAAAEPVAAAFTPATGGAVVPEMATTAPHGIAPPTAATTANPEAALADGETGTSPKAPAAEAEDECLCANGVRIRDMTDAEITFERPSVDAPWGLGIRTRLDSQRPPDEMPLVLLSLPPMAAPSVFAQRFRRPANWWQIAEVNGVPATNGHTAIEMIKKLTRMTLRFTRK